MNLGADSNDYKTVLEQKFESDKKIPIFRMVKKYFATSLGSSQVRWFVYDLYDVKMNPLTIRLTDELYEKFYSFFFDKNSEKEKLI